MMNFNDDYNNLRTSDRSLPLPPVQYGMNDMNSNQNVPPRTALSTPYPNYNYQNFMNPFMSYNSAYQYPYSGYNDNSLMSMFTPLNNTVQTLNAFSTLVNTTYNGLCTSISTIHGMIHQMKQSKNNLYQLISKVNILKLFLKLKVFIGNIINGNWPSIHDIVTFFTDMKKKITNLQLFPNENLFSYLLYLYLICGPFIIYKYIKMIEKQNVQNDTWDSSKGKCYAAKVLKDFIARKPDEMNVLVGDIVTIAPPEYQKEVNWYLVSNLKGDQGLVPSSFVNVLGVLEKNKNKE